MRDLLTTKPRIVVIGVGGAGGNAVTNMVAAGLAGIEFVAANTDTQALAASKAEYRIQLGSSLTNGLGAGSKPEIGEAAAEEALDEIVARISGAHMLFIAAGMGGGTGTGASYVIARAAKEIGLLTIGVVTKPFQFEGAQRKRNAEAGIAALKQCVDTLLVIPNENLFRVATERTTFAEAFLVADQVLYAGIRCLVDLIIDDGLINLDLADVKTVLSGMGAAMMGTGEAAGEQRAILAAEQAIVNPLLDDVSLKGAKSLLLSIKGSRDLTLWEVDEAVNRVRQEVDPDANIIVGAILDESLSDKMCVSIVASGMPSLTNEQPAYHLEKGSSWTPNSVSPLTSVRGHEVDQRFAEAIGTGNSQGKPRNGRRSGTRVRASSGDAASASEGAPQTADQPYATQRKANGAGKRRAPNQATQPRAKAMSMRPAENSPPSRPALSLDAGASRDWPEHWAGPSDGHAGATNPPTAGGSLSLRRQRPTLWHRVVGLIKR
jgi:cell division protein FtsZ